MDRPPTDREALIAALAAEARARAGETPEPEPEELLDYLAGRLAPDDEERVARRLAADPEAARALLDLAELEAAGAEAGGRPAELAAAAGWRDVQDRLPDASPRPRRFPPFLETIAAALLVATLGLSAWVWKLQQELHRPVANLESLELPSGSRAGEDRSLEIVPGQPLRLVLSPAERCPTYTAEVAGPRSRDRQTVDGLKRDERGLVTLLLRHVEPGLYSLHLAGCEPRRALEEHRFQIAPAP